MKKNNILNVIILILILCVFGLRVFTGNKAKKTSGSSPVEASKAAAPVKSEKEAAGTSAVPESSGDRKYKIDYDHIIGGDISANGEKVTGGHTLLKGDVRIVKKVGKAASNGVYKANVEILRPDGTWQKKTSNGGINTMFPEDWDEKRVIDEINSAWENRKDLKGKDSNMWQGVSKSGVLIRGYKTPRITAYPVFEGDK